MSQQHEHKTNQGVASFKSRMAALPKIKVSRSLDIKTRNESIRVLLHKGSLHENLMQPGQNQNSSPRYRIHHVKGRVGCQSDCKNRRKSTQSGQEDPKTPEFKTLDPQIKRTSLLPLIADKQDSEHIFRSEKPLSCPQKSVHCLIKTKSKEKKVEESQRYEQSPKKVLILKPKGDKLRLQKEIIAMMDNSKAQKSPEKQKQKSLGKGLRKNLASFNVYTRCFITKRKQRAQSFNNQEILRSRNNMEN